MPTYEYRCPEGHEFERFQRMSDEPEAECPECGKASERLLSGGAGLVFKGEGFYATDYRSDDYRKKASAEKEKTGGPGGSSEGGDGSDGGASSADGASSGGGSGSSSGDGPSSPGSSSSSTSSGE